MGKRNVYQPKGGEAVMPCGWRLNAGMLREWVTL